MTTNGKRYFMEGRLISRCYVDEDDCVVMDNIIICAMLETWIGKIIYDTNAKRFVMIDSVDKTGTMLTCVDGDEKFLIPTYDCKNLLVKENDGVLGMIAIVDNGKVNWQLTTQDYIERILKNDGRCYVEVTKVIHQSIIYYRPILEASSLGDAPLIFEHIRGDIDCEIVGFNGQSYINNKFYAQT